MFVLSAKLIFHIPCASSLKDKRQVSRSLIDRTRRRYNAAIAEVATQDVHRTLTIGVAVVSGDTAHAQRLLDEIIRYMEDSTNAELVEVELSEAHRNG